MAMATGTPVGRSQHQWHRAGRATPPDNWEVYWVGCSTHECTRYTKVWGKDQIVAKGGAHQGKGSKEQIFCDVCANNASEDESQWWSDPPQWPIRAGQGPRQTPAGSAAGSAEASRPGPGTEADVGTWLGEVRALTQEIARLTARVLEVQTRLEVLLQQRSG